MTNNIEILDHDKYTQRLFNDSGSNMVTNDYKNLIDKDLFKTKLTGVTYDNRQEYISTLESGQQLFLKHDSSNPDHPNAIRVLTEEGYDVGYLPRLLADEMVKVIEDNSRLIYVEEVTGNSDTDEFRGVNIQVKKIQPTQENRITGYPPSLKKEEFLDILAQELGFEEDYSKHRETIDKIILSKYVSLRGNDEYEKKLIITMVSLYKALKYRQKILFLYNDKQSIMEDSRLFHTMSSRYEVNIQELNTDKLENESFVSYMFNNKIDILISTYSNLEQLQLDYDFGLVVHNHLDQNLRYIKVHQIKQINAKTAIFNHYDFKRIKAKDLEDTFGVKTFFNIKAEGFTKNVTIVDKRNIKEKELFILNYLSKLKKSIIYVNTRKNAIELAKKIKSNLPRDLKSKVVFYHSGLHIEDKLIIEQKFRDNEYLFVVATTAFDIALNKDTKIENVFVYNPPYTFNALLNQIVQTAKYHSVCVYLVYGYEDVHNIKRIISSNVIDKNDLTYVYRTIKGILYDRIRENFGYFTCKNHQLRTKIQEVYFKQYQNNRLDIILKTLDEMKVINFEKKSNDYYIEILDVPEKANFEDTQTYLNNLIIVNMFLDFEILLLESVQKIHNALFNYS